MLSPTTYRDANGNDWTVTESAKIGAGMMQPGGELPPSAVVTLIFRRSKNDAVRIGSVDTEEWHDEAAIAHAFSRSTLVAL